MPARFFFKELSSSAISAHAHQSSMFCQKPRHRLNSWSNVAQQTFDVSVFFGKRDTPHCIEESSPLIPPGPPFPC
jgi:hypothetical protein